ncbi:MAG: GntR family transcriptional regulator [Acinetobacter sp.]|nr:GntR family transcriptional regulator [Acinetobacter sp.]
MNLSLHYNLDNRNAMKPHTLVKRSSSQVTDQAVEVIHERIQQGFYPVGSALPSQRELSAELGISRASLRESLTRLAALGLLNIMAGKGAYVTAIESQPVEQWNIQFKISLKDFYQLRYILEGFSALLACEYISENDLVQLNTHFEQLESAIQQHNWQEAAENDFAFHRHIIDLSHNQSIIQSLKKQTEWMKQSQILPFVQPNLAYKTIQEHEQILQALIKRDGLMAEKAMRQHIIGAAQRAGVYFSSHS